MGTPPAAPADPVAAASVRVLDTLSRGYVGGVTARLWTGDTWAAGGPAGFTLVLKHPGAVRAMLWPFDRLSVGESYVFDDFDVEGDVLAFTGWLRHLVGVMNGWSLPAKLGVLKALLALPRRRNPRDPAKVGRPRTAGQGVEADRRGISLHYDRPGAFYRLFLGPAMQYTCAYFRTPGDSLDDAQRQKMDHVCRKLRLRPGQRLLDVGCGWGGLLRHAVRYYGVTGVGVTLAGEQAEWAARANREAGLDQQIRIEFCHYRDMPFAAEFDAVSSVGMTEEVGNRNLPAYLGGVARALKPGGAYLHHAINLRPHTPFPRWTAFARKYVFPNGDLQTLPAVVAGAARAGLEARDVENLREHYTLTLRAWVRGLEANRAEAARLTDEATYRIYRLYMAGATMGFDAGVYQLNQILFVKPAADGTAGLPPTRADWYAPDLPDSGGGAARTPDRYPPS
jgi:cyclopropane-fatty-acyl-phospholipid synthase